MGGKSQGDISPKKSILFYFILFVCIASLRLCQDYFAYARKKYLLLFKIYLVLKGREGIVFREMLASDQRSKYVRFKLFQYFVKFFFIPCFLNQSFGLILFSIQKYSIFKSLSKICSRNFFFPAFEDLVSLLRCK